MTLDASSEQVFAGTRGTTSMTRLDTAAQARPPQLDLQATSASEETEIPKVQTLACLETAAVWAPVLLASALQLHTLLATDEVMWVLITRQVMLYNPRWQIRVRALPASSLESRDILHSQGWLTCQDRQLAGTLHRRLELAWPAVARRTGVLGTLRLTYLGKFQLTFDSSSGREFPLSGGATTGATSGLAAGAATATGSSHQHAPLTEIYKETVFKHDHAGHGHQYEGDPCETGHEPAPGPRLIPGPHLTNTANMLDPKVAGEALPPLSDDQGLGSTGRSTGTGMDAATGAGLGATAGAGLGSSTGAGLGSSTGTGLGSTTGTGLGSSTGTGLATSTGASLGPRSERGTGM